MAGKIFINYRRDDSAAHALNIAQYLERTFGDRSVFIDVDRLRAGQMFPQVLEQRLAQSDVMLTVIGPAWLEVRKEDGTRRIDDPEDWVRMEIERAIARGITVIPVTVAGAKLPSQEQLPDTLKPLVHYHAVNLTTGGFRAEMNALVHDLKSGRSSYSARAGVIIAALAIALAAAGYVYRADLTSAANRVLAGILTTKPEGPTPEEIRAKEEQARAAAELAEQSAYAVARAADTAAAWQTYLQAHPQGIHASAAANRLGELREAEDAKRKAAEEAQRAAEAAAAERKRAEDAARAEAEARRAALQVFDGRWSVKVCPQSKGCVERKCSPLYGITIKDRVIVSSSGWTSGLPAAISEAGEFRFTANNGVRNSGTLSGDTGSGRFSAPETSDSYGCSGSLSFARVK